MTFDEIETFLAVVEHGNIARAADQLYIGQGTASSRVQHLEQELEIPLFVRGKGIKTVILTPEGEAFLSIAQQWAALWHQARQIKNRMIFRELRISAVDSMNLVHFQKVYRSFMERNPGIQLFLQTEHSTEAHLLIERQRIDMAFVFNLHEAHSVVSYPLFREACVLLFHRGSAFDRSRSFSDLPPEGEIYPTMGRDFDLWHNRVFANSPVRKVSVGTNSLVEGFMAEENSWSVIPQSLADTLAAGHPEFAYMELLDDPPPVRTAYVLFYQYAKPWIRELCGLFLRDVADMIRKTPALTPLYDPARRK